MEDNGVFIFNRKKFVKGIHAVIADTPDTVSAINKFQFFVGEKGAAVTGVDGGYLYDNGLMVQAESDKYEIVEVDGLDYLVKENGKVVTKGTVKDNDAGVSYTVSKAEGGGYNIETKLLD